MMIKHRDLIWLNVCASAIMDFPFAGEHPCQFTIITYDRSHQLIFHGAAIRPHCWDESRMQSRDQRGFLARIVSRRKSKYFIIIIS